MNITVRSYLLRRRKKLNGKIPVYLRIIQNEKYSLVFIGFAVESNHWAGLRELPCK